MTRDEILEAVARASAMYFAHNRQPVMSGDPLDRLSPMLRRECFDSARAVLDALDELGQGPKRVAELEKVARPLAAIAGAFEDDALDEARPSWGDKPDGVEIYSGRGGKRLLTLDDAFAARAALKGQDNG